MKQDILNNVKRLDAEKKTVGELYDKIFNVLFVLNVQEDVEFNFLENLTSGNQDALLDETKKLLLLKLFEYKATVFERKQLSNAFQEFCDTHNLDVNEAKEEVHMVFSTLEEVYEYMTEAEDYNDLLVEKHTVTVDMMLKSRVGTPEQYLATKWASCHKTTNGYVVFDL